MAETAAQIWKSSNFTIERKESDQSGTVVFRMSGPFTARDMYSSMSPDRFNAVFDAPQGGEAPRIYRVDLTEVPYMDSAGLGLMVRLYARCQSKGIQLIVVGAGPRVLELFRITKIGELLQPKSAL